jgi:ABC-type cobalamin/Fe3+-siderophores transport system ATPase subunit
MIKDKITLQNIKNISFLSVEFTYPESNIVVVTGKNGVGKTSLVKAFHFIADPQVFEKTAGLNAVRTDSHIAIEIGNFEPFSFKFNENLSVLDTKDSLPNSGEIDAELPIPYGKRFGQFSLIANFDSEIRSNFAANQYESAEELIGFLSQVYANNKFAELKATKVNKYEFYFIPRNQDYYIREDHLSSGEFFLIQIYRLITSGAKLVLIDEFDVALDASAQVRIYAAIKPLLIKYGTRLIVISHSLAFMNTVDDGGLYYLEEKSDGVVLEQRSFGYVKSDLYGFKGKDRYIITEDVVLVGFLNYLIQKNISTFFQYEIIEVGGQPQIDTIGAKNDSHRIFGAPGELVIFVDKDIVGQLKYKGASKVLNSPVNDIELFIWLNKDVLLPDVIHPEFTHAEKDKNTAKTYWKKLIRSKQKSREDLYALVVQKNHRETSDLIEELRKHLCLV